MKCSYAAFGEQNKTDKDCKCQQVYKSLFLRFLLPVPYKYAPRQRPTTNQGRTKELRKNSLPKKVLFIKIGVFFTSHNVP